MKALKITVSGSYKTSNNEIVEFENISGFVPYVEDEYAKMHVRRRYTPEWVKNAVDRDGKKLYPNRIDRMRQVFIEEIEEVDHKFEYIGKDIKKMSYGELQDLATAKDLRTIPLPKQTSGVDIREMREKAYLEYSAKVMRDPINVKNPDPEYSSKQGSRSVFDFAKLPPLFVESGEARIDTSSKVTNDEILNLEMKPRDLNSTLKDDFSLADLKAIAKEKGINYHHKIGFDKLYDMLYGSGSID